MAGYLLCRPVFPLYFLDPEKRVIGLAHGGWRGTAGRIGRKMVEKMKAEYGCRPERIIGAIGPSIGACCYEVDEPVAREFLALSDLETERFVMDKKNGKYNLDLWEPTGKSWSGPGCVRKILQ